MSSMWSCLCMKKKRITLTRRNKTRKKRSFKDSESVSEVSSSAYRQLTSPGEFDVNFIGANTTFSLGNDGHCDENTMTKLLKNTGPKKRRRVQDIFNQPPAQYRNPYDFSTECYPRKRDILSRFPEKQNAFLSAVQETESMYGYVPKAMQDVYASTALQGYHVEDYFSNCRPSDALRKFASADMCQNMEREWNENGRNVLSIVHTLDTFGDNSGGHLTIYCDDVINDRTDKLRDDIIADPSDGLIGDVFTRCPGDVLSDPDKKLCDVVDSECERRLQTSKRYSSKPLIVGSCSDTSVFSSQTSFECGTDDDMLY